jgi:DNA invertase Pin-like site-specific DNA recombinase
MIKKVGIYCRISGNKEEDKDTSIATQEEAGIAFATKLELPYKIYHDIGKSGTSYEKRDDFNLFIADIQKGIITDVFAINQSRIERDIDTWRMFTSTVLNAKAKWYPNGLFYDLDSTTNRLLADMLSLVNGFHAQNTSDAVKIAFERNAKAGKCHGINAYGIQSDKDGYMEHNPVEIKIVKKIFKWSLEGIGAYSIAKMLNEMEDAPTRYASLDSSTTSKDEYTGEVTNHSNKKWWGSTVSGILKKKLYMGIHTWGKDEETDEPIEFSLPDLAILSEEEFEEVQQNFAKNKRTKVGQPPKHKYLLNGLLYCSECGNKFFGKRRLASRENTYKCRGKEAPKFECVHSRGFNIAKVETFILKHLFLTKDLQDYLNSIDIDDDSIEVLELERKQLVKKINSTDKQTTKAFNNMNDPDLFDDIKFKELYLSRKKKLKNQRESLIVLEESLHHLKFNNRLENVNKTIDGFNINAGFKPIKKAVHDLIKRINVEYRPLEKNGRFIFTIKYRGFAEVIEYAATQQLDRFACIDYYRIPEWSTGGVIHKKNEYFLKHGAKFNEYFDRFYNHHTMPVRVNKNELFTFE